MIFLGFFQRSAPAVPCQHLRRSAARAGHMLAWQCDACGDLEVTGTDLRRAAAYHGSNAVGR